MRRSRRGVAAGNGAVSLRGLACALLTACLLLPLVALWPAAAQAQTVSYIANVNQPTNNAFRAIESRLIRAQTFRTGSQGPAAIRFRMSCCA